MSVCGNVAPKFVLNAGANSGSLSRKNKRAENLLPIDNLTNFQIKQQFLSN